MLAAVILVHSSSNRSSGVSEVGGGSGVSGNVVVMGVGDDGSGDGLLDDGLSLDSHGVRDVVGGVNVDGGGDLHDLLGVVGGVIGDLDPPLDVHGLVDGVDLGLGLDNGSGDGLGSFEDGRDLDGKMRGGGLVDGGGVSGHVGGLTIVDLLGHNGGGLVDAGHTLGLGVGGVGGGHGNGGSGGNSNRCGVRDGQGSGS